MDTVVTPAGPDVWTIVDRLGRVIGTIKRLDGGPFIINPTTDKLPGLNSEKFASLDLAMGKIEQCTKGASELTQG